MKRLVYRKCPFCDQNKYFVEQVGKGNLYLLTCASPNTSAGFHVELNRRGRFSRVALKERSTTRMSLHQKSLYDKLQIPFWRMMGQKAKPHEAAMEKEMKRRGWTYGDLRLERDHAAGASEQSAMSQFESHYNKYGTKNLPDPKGFTKISKAA